MRISTTWMYQQSVNQMEAQESSLEDAENAVSTGNAISVASDDPAGAGQSVSLSHLIATQDSYVSSISSASTRLSTEQTALTSTTNLLDEADSLAIQAGDGALSSTDRTSIATQLSQVLTQLQEEANSTDANGDYLFSGTSSSTPFVTNSDGSVSYEGTDSTQLASAGSGLQVSTSDTGSSVFMDIPTGNGSYVASASDSNSGTLVVGSTSVSDTAAYDSATSTYGDDFEVSFDGDGNWTAYASSGSASGDVVASGTYTDGDSSISFDGMDIDLSGTPSAGDSVSIESGSTQSVFTTLQNMIDALNDPDLSSTQLTNTMNRQLESIQNALTQVSTTQSSVGSRLTLLQDQSSNYSDLSVTYQTALSGVQDTDMYSAISNLSLQSTALQASEEAFAKVSQLSLFNYIQG
ncbi:flagellar hook-associated protein FlgL [Frateuria aurantia]